MTMTSDTPATPGSGLDIPAGSDLEIRDLTLAFGSIDVVRGVSLQVAAGTTTCIVGPSGSGKSTLLRGINRLHEAASGDVFIAGQNARDMSPERLRARVGMVFQNFNLFPDHTALGNVALALKSVKRISSAQAKEIALERLTEVGLADWADHRPRQLSGGQQQRVAIARALAMAPEAMLFDEVTSALDPELVKGILSLMERLARGGMTMVVVTHEMGFARRVANQVVFMDKGVVIESGPPDQLFDAPKSERLRIFLSQVL
jgi:polar amino acid transport system ATP-binding protein